MSCECTLECFLSAGDVLTDDEVILLVKVLWWLEVCGGSEAENSSQQQTQQRQRSHRQQIKSYLAQEVQVQNHVLPLPEGSCDAKEGKKTLNITIDQ